MRGYVILILVSILYMFHIKYLSTHLLQATDVLLRVDFNVSLNPNHTIANDERIHQALPTIRYLLQKKNRLVILSHLGRPEGRDPSLSLKNVSKDLQSLLPEYDVLFVSDIEEALKAKEQQNYRQVILMDNIRYYKEEDENDETFAKKLASLGKCYVNDAFSVCHRKAASIVAITQFLPSYAGFLLEKEIKMIGETIAKPKHPFVAILGGAKISTKITLINRLLSLTDALLLGGGLANNFLAAKGYSIGKSIIEKDAIGMTKHLLTKHEKQILLPQDVLAGKSKDTTAAPLIKKVTEIMEDEMILDIGPETEAHYAPVVSNAKTIIWNGPVGYLENPHFKGGTDFLYYLITENTHAISIVGGGETLSALEKKEYLDKITHISTGGGAMLEFIENGTLPGIQALEKHNHD